MWMAKDAPKRGPKLVEVNVEVNDSNSEKKRGKLTVPLVSHVVAPSTKPSANDAAISELMTLPAFANASTASNALAKTDIRRKMNDVERK
jgi:uncharacterized pyridoxal phosphate-containing UPF0001 family protein